MTTTGKNSDLLLEALAAISLLRNEGYAGLATVIERQVDAIADLETKVKDMGHDLQLARADIDRVVADRDHLRIAHSAATIRLRSIEGEVRGMIDRLRNGPPERSAERGDFLASTGG